MNRSNKIKAVALSLILPAFGFCQAEAASNNTYFSNALFNTLLGIVILLLIIIIAFSNVIKNVAESDFLQKKLASDNEKDNNGVSKTIVSLLFVFMSFSMMAQEGGAAKKDLIGGIDPFTFYFMLTVIFVELIFLGLLIFQFKFLLKTKATVVADRRESAIMHSLTDAVAVENEESILLDHDYDGIKELDNNLPPWWKYGFYLTIVFAFIYLINYHVTGSLDLQQKEYEKEMAQAKADVEAYMKTAANNVDENSVKPLTGADLEAGKQAFIASCAACHGKIGEGGVGPNLTDDYWLHGGSLQDIFKSIKYGWVEKGMKSWKEDLSPMQIAQVSSFIRSLKGTNPPNGKAPQGDLYSDQPVNASDSTAVKADTLKVEVKADSLNNVKVK